MSSVLLLRYKQSRTNSNSYIDWYIFKSNPDTARHSRLPSSSNRDYLWNISQVIFGNLFKDQPWIHFTGLYIQLPIYIYIYIPEPLHSTSGGKREKIKKEINKRVRLKRMRLLKIDQVSLVEEKVPLVYYAASTIMGIITQKKESQREENTISLFYSDFEITVFIYNLIARWWKKKHMWTGINENLNADEVDRRSGGRRRRMVLLRADAEPFHHHVSSSHTWLGHIQISINARKEINRKPFLFSNIRRKKFQFYNPLIPTREFSKETKTEKWNQITNILHFHGQIR